MELTEPVLTDRAAGPTSPMKPGLDGTVRFLRDEAGLWLLQETLRAWDRAGSGRVRGARQNVQVTTITLTPTAS